MTIRLTTKAFDKICADARRERMSLADLARRRLVADNGRQRDGA